MREKDFAPILEGGGGVLKILHIFFKNPIKESP